jgi:hypothetical protein
MREALSIVLIHFAIVSKLFSAFRWNLAITKMPMSHHLDDGDDAEYNRNCPLSRSASNLSEVQNFSAKFQSSTYGKTEHGGCVVLQRVNAC